MLKASVIGNLGTDPELRYSPSGAPSLRVNVASNFRARTPEGEWEDRTEWVRVIIFGQPLLVWQCSGWWITLRDGPGTAGCGQLQKSTIGRDIPIPPNSS